MKDSARKAMFAKKNNYAPIIHSGKDDRIKKSKTHQLEFGRNNKGQAVIRHIPIVTKSGRRLNFNLDESIALIELLKNRVLNNDYDLKNNGIHPNDEETYRHENKVNRDVIKKLEQYNKTYLDQKFLSTDIYPVPQPRFAEEEVGQINVASYAELLMQNDEKESNYKLIDSIESKSDMR
jgi:hypothetical protein